MGSKKKNKKSRSTVTTDKKRKSLFIVSSLAVVLIAAVVAVIVATSGADDAGNNDSQPNVSENSFSDREGNTGITTEVQKPAQPSGLIKATWIESQIDGDSVSIPISQVEQKWNTHFGLGNEYGNMNFMAYLQNGEIQVRANVCPPCQSIGFSLNGDILVCDRCGTRFDAGSGAGISGACKDYPKAKIAYDTSGNEIIMRLQDLASAYEETIELG